MDKMDKKFEEKGKLNYFGGGEKENTTKGFTFPHF